MYMPQLSVAYSVKCGWKFGPQQENKTVKSGVISCLSGEPELMLNYLSLRSLSHMVACEVLRRTWRGSWQSAVFHEWLQNTEFQKVPLLPVFQPENHIWTKSWREDSLEAPQLPTLGYSVYGVCDCTLAKLTNNVAKKWKINAYQKWGKNSKG